MRDEKEERKKQAKVKQTNKAKQHSTPKAVTFPRKNEHVHVYVHRPMTLQYISVCNKNQLDYNYSYKESRNDDAHLWPMLPNLSPSPNPYKVQSVYNNNLAS